MEEEDLASLSFEAALKRLEEIAQQLERGTPTLEEALALVEEGLRLQSHCRRLLEEAEGRFRRLVPLAGGEPQVQEEPWPLAEEEE